MKTTDFIKEDENVPKQDHEVTMAREECFHASEDAAKLHDLLQQVSEVQGLDGWVSEKISLAADYLKTVREFLEYQLMQSQGENMSEFESAVAEQYLGQLLGDRRPVTEMTSGGTGSASVSVAMAGGGGNLLGGPEWTGNNPFKKMSKKSKKPAKE